MRRRIGAGVAFGAGLVAALTACGDGVDSSGFTARDSAGIHIVENAWRSVADLPVCSVDSVPVIDIGVVEGDPHYQLYRVFDALRVSDGRIAVVNQGSSEIRFFNAQGRYAGAVGREGDGPGEFRGVQAVWQDADSLLAWDDESQRFSVFRLDGSFVRAFPITPVLMNAPQVLGPVGGSIHVAYHQVVFEPPGLAPQSLYHMRYDRTGSVIDTLAAYPYGTYGPIGRPEDAMAGRTLFEPRTSMTASTEHLYVSEGAEPEFRVLDADGAVLEIVRWPDPDRAVRAEHVDTYREERLARTTDPEYRRLIQLSVDEVPVSERFPSVADLRVDETGRAWVRRYPRPGAGADREWLVFGPDRSVVCRAEIPSGFSLARIQHGMLLGMEQDESDVEHVRAYRFTAERAGTAVP